MCPEDLLLLITSIAIAIGREQPAENVAVYASAFTMLGDALATFLAQGEFLENCCQNKESDNTVC